MAKNEPVRLHHYIAQCGVTSRRKAELLIAAGRVSVNGKKVTTLGTKVDPSRDKVTLDNQRLTAQQHVWLLLNKPDKVVCSTRDPEGRTTVMDLLGPQLVRLYPVGRLDYHTEGVLLLTNDGDLARALTHPSSEVERVYHVKVRGLVSIAQLDELRNGVRIGVKLVKADRVAMLATTSKHSWIEIAIHQGMNHQIHKMVEAVGSDVLKLHRVAFGGITVEGLATGKHRELTQSEVDELRAFVGLKSQSVKTPTNRPRGRRRSLDTRSHQSRGR